MTNNKLLAALCYFSVFFSPLLLPFIVFLVVEDREVKHHAKRALVSHLVPSVLLIAGLIITSFSMMSFQFDMGGMDSRHFELWSFVPFIFIVIYGILFLAIVVWNVLQGVKILR